jgi:hypothetical protein
VAGAAALYKMKPGNDRFVDQERATANVVTGNPAGAPNLLLYLYLGIDSWI